MNVSTAAACFSILGHKKRLEIIKLLVKSASEGLTMNEIATSSKTPNSTLTHHIKLLENVGLIKRQQEAQSIRCSVDINVIKFLSQFLLEECCINSNKKCC